MSKPVLLSDGNTAQIRTAAEIPERLRRAHLAMQGKMLAASGIRIDTEGEPDASDFDPAVLEYTGPMNDALILCHLERWSYDKPVSAESLLDLPSVIYDELLEHAKSNNSGAVLDVRLEDAKDPNSPTEPLGE